ncbi:MAG TPA: fibronectin type III domain-containing protein [Chthoniobacteraceae bacterium]|nr:fibronectin type III domain-containing protein [Chthoniobacteraceae bacterium]
MNQLNRTPHTIVGLGSAAAAALTGAITHGAAIGLEHNNAEAIGADYHRLFGDPAATLPELRIGKQGEYREAVAQAIAATAANQLTVKSCQDFFVAAVDLLRPSFGRYWNTAWNTAGFTFGTLKVPNDPRPALLELRAYFQLHPERESVERNVNAARAQTLIGLLDAARLSVATKEAAKTAAKQSRDEAFEKLRARVRDLRGELVLLLDDDDARWYQFGFRRPIDGRMPLPVEGLLLSAGSAGEVNVVWQASTRAVNYRVKRMLIGTDTQPVEVGLFTDLGTTIRPLSSGVTVRVEVSSRNSSGETAPATATIAVP